VRLVPTQPTVGGADKIEVAEFFWYGCPHCYTFEPYINEWAANKPANVRFVRVPAMWNRGLELHAQLYYTEEVLVANGIIKDPAAFREAVFAEYHRRGNRLGSKDAIQAFFGRFDVSADEFDRAWASFEVNQKMRVAPDLARRYGIASVPMVVVNGKYRTSGAEAGTLDALMEVINELVAREELR
jgi:thiol:disulfide interchange protein DsbA